MKIPLIDVQTAKINQKKFIGQHRAIQDNLQNELDKSTLQLNKLQTQLQKIENHLDFYCPAYWDYESSLGIDNCISVRGRTRWQVEEMVQQFKQLNSNIKEINENHQFFDGTWCTMIHFNGMDFNNLKF